MESASVSAEALRGASASHPELRELGQALATQWWDIGPGTHRLSFEAGRVLLTMCIGDVGRMLREQTFAADSVVLGGGGPNADRSWDAQTLKSVARCCRRGTIIAGGPGGDATRQDLKHLGFALDDSEWIRGRFDPHWEPRGQRGGAPIAADTCVVIGGGLAGAAAAASLARRGWHVTVIDAAAEPASGASALPAGLLAPQLSSDDNLLSRLCQRGLRMTLQEARRLLREGQDWQATGVIERRAVGASLRHEQAGWIQPAALVRAWLKHDHIDWLGDTCVAEVKNDGDRWQVLGAQGALLASAGLVVIAAAQASAALGVDLPPVHPVRGQVSWGFHEPGMQFPAMPLKGNGHFIPCVPRQGRSAWLAGSTYGSGESSTEERIEDHRFNLERLASLAPEVAAQLAPVFERGEVHAWAGVRCASNDRRPLLGELAPGLWVSTAMGSRGLTFAVLCAELLAARLHSEPLPVESKLAAALDAHRHRGRHPPPELPFGDPRC